MGINRNIFEEVGNLGSTYGFSGYDIEDFLTVPKDFSSRQSQAIDVIRDIMTHHGKEVLLRHVVQVAEVERGIRPLEPWVRDHVVHALLSFMLGIFVHEKLLKPEGFSLDPFQWKLAGLFHDVGYPAQVAKDILKPYSDKINSIKNELGVRRPDVFFKVVPVGIDKLSRGVKSFDLIQSWLDKWMLRINAKAEYDMMMRSGGVCHGMISALSILYVIDLMYQKFNPNRNYADIDYPPGINWNHSYFKGDVASACSAIFIHNLPKRCFKHALIDPNHAALAFLLRLSDCMQDWERPSESNPNGFPDRDYRIEVISGKLILTVTDPDRKIKIEDEIVSSLVAPNIEIRQA